jgi:hypothetical protein
VEETVCITGECSVESNLAKTRVILPVCVCVLIARCFVEDRIGLARVAGHVFVLRLWRWRMTLVAEAFVILPVSMIVLNAPTKGRIVARNARKAALGYGKKSRWAKE